MVSGVRRSPLGAVAANIAAPGTSPLAIKVLNSDTEMSSAPDKFNRVANSDKISQKKLSDTKVKSQLLIAERTKYVWNQV